MVLKGGKCCRIWRVLKWVNVHQFTNFSQIVLEGDSLCCYTACCLATLLVALIPMGSALAAWGTFSWAPWWTLLSCAPWGSLLCAWGSPWAAGGHWGCLSAGCLVLCCWGWISPVVQVLLVVSPSPRLWLISFLNGNLMHLLVLCHILLP